jgi:acyl carrier protein
MSNNIGSENSSLKYELRKLIANAIGVNEDQLTEETSLLRNFGLDSLAILKIVTLIEHKYKIDLDEEQLELMDNLRTAYKYIDHLVGKTS